MFYLDLSFEDCFNDLKKLLKYYKIYSKELQKKLNKLKHKFLTKSKINTSNDLILTKDDVKLFYDLFDSLMWYFGVTDISSDNYKTCKRKRTINYKPYLTYSSLQCVLSKNSNF